MRRTLLALMAAGPLAACVPQLEAPPAAIDAIGIPAHDHPAVTARPIAHDWWTLFGSPQLNELQAIALRNNPGLAEATARVEAAQSEVARIDASRSLHLDSTDKITRVHNSHNGDRAIYNGKTYTLGDLDLLNINYHLDLWGQDRELVAAAQADENVAAARRAQSELLLTAAVTKTWLAWQTADRLQADAQALVDLASDASAIKAAATRAGVAPASEQVTQDAAVDAAQARLAGLTQRCEALRYAMAALLGKGPDDAPPLVSTDSVPQDIPLPAQIGLDQLAERPDVQIALWSVRSALHQQELAKTAYYPNINLRAVAGLTSIGLDELFRMNSLGLAAGPAINLPLFEGGALDASLHGKAAAHAAAIDAYNKTVLDAAAQVATDLSALDNRQHAVADLDAAHTSTSRLLTIAEVKYHSGISDRFEPVQAHIREKSAEMDEREARLNWLYAITDTEADLGGGLYAHE